MMKKQTLISLILLIIVSTYFAKDILLQLLPTIREPNVTNQVEPTYPQGLPSKADYFFQQVVITQFTEQGQIQNKITADKIEHFKQSQVSEIAAASLTLSNSHQNLWLLKADTGRLNHNSNQIFLADTVKIEQIIANQTDQAEQDSTSLSPGFELNTVNLLLDLTKQTANTNAPINMISRAGANSVLSNKTIQIDQIKSHAIGLQADFNKEQFKLLNEPNTQGVIHTDE
jgi:LPS export ABC transporter protein LptC